MAKQADETSSFDKVFLDYLRMRFACEPLLHYVMAAITVCNSTGAEYPEFVRSFFVWATDRFLFEPSVDRKGKEMPLGSFPIVSWNENRLGAQWSRYEDCHDLLVGWLTGDLLAAIKRQDNRIALVQEVEFARQQLRDDPPGKAGRSRKKLTITDTDVFNEMEDAFDEKSHTLRRRYKKLALPKEFMSGVVPIALVSVDGKYIIETRTAGTGHPLAVRLSPKRK